MNPLLAKIYACISFITFPLFYYATLKGRDFVPKPNEAIYKLSVTLLYKDIEHRTV